MKFLRYLIIGIVFGITLAKAEVISWYRIYEMFKFQSFHMYGVIASAVILGIVATRVIKRFNIKTFDGRSIIIAQKKFSVARYLIGGAIFGLGWALTGACPGPMFILVGNGITVFIVVIASAVLGTYAYGLLRHRLPH